MANISRQLGIPLNELTGPGGEYTSEQEILLEILKEAAGDAPTQTHKYIHDNKDFINRTTLLSYLAQAFSGEMDFVNEPIETTGGDAVYPDREQDIQYPGAQILNIVKLLDEMNK